MVVCFNAPKNKQLGWYTEYEVDVSGGWKGRIYGVATKGLATKGRDIVLARIPGSFDFYVSFNAKSGINSGTLEGANQVLVHVRNKGFTYGESTLVAKLSAGQTYKDANLPITVNRISGEFYAEVTIGTLTDSPTRSPIGSPTRPPVIVRTSSPTKSPVMAPTTVLNDATCQDTIWKFLLRVKPDGKKLFRKCGWVTSKPGKEQARCKRSRVQSFCPKACSPYTNGGSEIYCSQDAKGKFALDDNIATLVRCDADKAKSRCSENQVNAVCRETCPSLSSTQSESDPEVTSHSYTTSGNIHWTIFGPWND